MATFGYNGTGNATSQTNNYISLSYVTADATVNISSISFYVVTNSASGNTNYKCALYADNGTAPNGNLPTTLIAATNAGVLGAGVTGWLTLNFSSPPAVVSGTKYWLAVWADGTSGTILIGRNTATGNRALKPSGYTGNFDSPVMASWSTNQYSIYASYSTTTVYTMEIAPATFTYTPQSMGNPVTRNITVNPASFILIGMAIGFTTKIKQIYYMVIAPAQFILTGMQLQISKLGEQAESIWTKFLALKKIK